MAKTKQKTGYGLIKHLGVLKGDKEYDKLKSEIKSGWAKWTKKYA